MKTQAMIVRPDSSSGHNPIHLDKRQLHRDYQILPNFVVSFARCTQITDKARRTTAVITPGCSRRSSTRFRRTTRRRTRAWPDGRATGSGGSPRSRRPRRSAATGDRPRCRDSVSSSRAGPSPNPSENSLGNSSASPPSGGQSRNGLPSRFPRGQ